MYSSPNRVLTNYFRHVRGFISVVWWSLERVHWPPPTWQMTYLSASRVTYLYTSRVAWLTSTTRPARRRFLRTVRWLLD